MTHLVDDLDELDDESASARNARVTTRISEIGKRNGFTVVKEYPVPGGRIDVVWLWQPPMPIPGAESVLPIVGFEIESSWRTRKHIKGDLLNLQDLRPLVGVIVLLGADAKVESTRRFASALVDRPGTRVLVWSDQDLDALDAGNTDEREVNVGLEDMTEAGSSTPLDHVGKYRPLWQWLRGQDESPATLSFNQVEDILGFPLPPSSRRHLPHWYGYQGTAVGRAIRDAGWRARDVDLVGETVIFERTTGDEHA